MLAVLSPAKSLDYESPLPTRKRSEPRMLDRATELVALMRTKTAAQIAGLMSVSDDIAALNVQRYADFHVPFTPKNARPAVLAFNGDVYRGLDAAGRFGERDFTEAQKSVRILSGLYGVLRPLDLMQPYRLEMGTRLATDHGATLYDFWGDAITRQLNADLAASPGPDVLINLASGEYFGAVHAEALDGRVISPRFLDERSDGSYRVVSFFAKHARGAMAAWLVAQRVRSARAIRNFDGDGYRYDPSLSSAAVPVFVRPRTRVQAALRAPRVRAA